MTKVSGPSKFFSIIALLREPSSETLLRLAELILTLNCFSFGGNYYKQIMAWPWVLKLDPATQIFS